MLSTVYTKHLLNTCIILNRIESTVKTKENTMKQKDLTITFKNVNSNWQFF